MAKKPEKVTWGDWFFWYGTITGVLFTACAALPPVPWRYAKVDTNVGNRFVTDRRYGLLGCSNNFGQNQMWFGLRTKMQRKTEEFGRPSPLTALVGAAGSYVGSGGAALGCMMWQACKEHVATRYLSYGTVAIVGILSMAMLGIGALCGLASLVLCSFEDDGGKKKKKKKKKDEDALEPKTKTMIASIFLFMLPFCATLAFNFSLDSTLKGFKLQAYYPYAAAFVGFFVACFACFINYIVMLLAINRKYHCCARQKKKDKGGGEGEDMFGGGGGGGGGEWGGDYGGGYGGGGGGYGGGGGGYGGGGGGWEGGGGEGYGKGGW